MPSALTPFPPLGYRAAAGGRLGDHPHPAGPCPPTTTAAATAIKTPSFPRPQEEPGGRGRGRRSSRSQAAHACPSTSLHMDSQSNDPMPPRNSSESLFGASESLKPADPNVRKKSCSPPIEQGGVWFILLFGLRRGRLSNQEALQ